MAWWASSGDKMQQVLSNFSITLITSLTAGKNLSSTDIQKVYLKQT
jgi:hypothetical protein